MDPFTATLLLQGLIGGGKALFGASQRSKARKLEASLDRPKYRPPAAASEAAATARNAFLDNDTLMQLGRRLIEAQNATTAGQIQNSGGSANAQLGALAGIHSSSSDSLRRLAMNQQGVNDQRRNQFLQQLDRMAQYQDQSFQVNQMNPYNEGVAAAADLRNAGNQNIYGGLTALGQVGGNAARGAQLGMLGGQADTAAAGWQRPPMPGDPIYGKTGTSTTVNPFLNRFAFGMNSAGSSPGMGGGSNFNNNYQKVMASGQ